MSNSPNFGDSLGRLRKRKRPASQRVGIIMDSDYQQRVEDAQRRVSKLQLRANLHKGGTNLELAGELEDAEGELRIAEEEAAEYTEWFIAKAMAPRAFDALMASHAPTKDQKTQARKDNQVLQWNPDTFPPALLSSCVYLVTKLDEPDPETGDLEHHEPLTEEFVKEMHEGGGEQSQWNIGEVAALVQAAIAANQRGPQRVADLGNA